MSQKDRFDCAMSINGEYLSEMPAEDWDCDDDDGPPSPKKVAISKTNSSSRSESEQTASIEEDSRKFNETFDKEVEEVKRCLAEERRIEHIISLERQSNAELVRRIDEYHKDVQEIESASSSQ